MWIGQLLRVKLPFFKFRFNFHFSGEKRKREPKQHYNGLINHLKQRQSLFHIVVVLKTEWYISERL